MTIESEGISPLLQRTRDKKMFNVFNIAFFVLFAFICVYPFYYLIINSISDNTLSAAGKIAVLPKGINWSNYVEVFKQECLGTAAMVFPGTYRDRCRPDRTGQRLPGLPFHPGEHVAP